MILIDTSAVAGSAPAFPGSGLKTTLGRAITVEEDPDTQNLATSYSYDTLGNLKLVTQGRNVPATPVAPPTAGCRYYTYDSLSRWIERCSRNRGRSDPTPPATRRTRPQSLK